MTFREFMDQQVGNPKPKPNRRPNKTSWRVSSSPKTWKAKKEDIVRHWQNLEPNLPVRPDPISIFHKGTRYDTDGLRITGTAAFINSVLSRVKEILQYDSFPGASLDVEYRQVRSKNREIKTKPSYACYVHVMQEKPHK